MTLAGFDERWLEIQRLDPNRCTRCGRRYRSPFPSLCLACHEERAIGDGRRWPPAAFDPDPLPRTLHCRRCDTRHLEPFPDLCRCGASLDDAFKALRSCDGGVPVRSSDPAPLGQWLADHAEQRTRAALGLGPTRLRVRCWEKRHHSYELGRRVAERTPEAPFRGFFEFELRADDSRHRQQLSREFVDTLADGLLSEVRHGDFVLCAGGWDGVHDSTWIERGLFGRTLGVEVAFLRTSSATESPRLAGVRELIALADDVEQAEVDLHVTIAREMVRSAMEPLLDAEAGRTLSELPAASIERLRIAAGALAAAMALLPQDLGYPARARALEAASAAAAVVGLYAACHLLRRCDRPPLEWCEDALRAARSAQERILGEQGDASRAQERLHGAQARLGIDRLLTAEVGRSLAAAPADVAPDAVRTWSSRLSPERGARRLLGQQLIAERWAVACIDEHVEAVDPVTTVERTEQLCAQLPALLAEIVGCERAVTPADRPRRRWLRHWGRLRAALTTAPRQAGALSSDR